MISIFLGGNFLPLAIFWEMGAKLNFLLIILKHQTLACTHRELEGPSKLKGNPLRPEVFASLHKAGVKAITFANTPENQRVSKSVFKVKRIIDLVDT